jgi:porphobilinogen deaminase
MEIRLGIRDTDRLCRAQTELVASQIKKACPEVTFTRRELAGYIGGSEEDEHWITDVVNAISQGRIDMGVVSMKKLMKAESSVIWNRGINLTAITRRRDARTVLITKKQKTKGGLSREKSQARETAVLYTSSMDIKERCPYVYADTECLYDNSLDDCLIRLHNDECDGVITQADILRLYKYNHMKDYIYDYIPTSIYVPETGEAMSAVLTSTDADIIDMVSRVSDENAVKCINIESDTIQRLNVRGYMQMTRAMASIEDDVLRVDACIYNHDKSLHRSNSGDVNSPKTVITNLVSDIISKI